MLLDADVLTLSYQKDASLIINSSMAPIFILKSILNFDWLNSLPRDNKEYVYKILGQYFILLFHQSVDVFYLDFDPRGLCLKDEAHNDKETVDLLPIKPQAFGVLSWDIQLGDAVDYLIFEAP